MNTNQKKKQCNININALFFDIAFVLYVFWGCFRDADLAFSQMMPFSNNKVAYLSVLFSIFCIIRNRLSIPRLFLLFIVAGFAVFFKRTYGYFEILPISFLVFAAANISVDHIIKVCFRATIVSTLFIILLTFLGILPDKVFNHRIGDGQVVDAHTFGFFYYSGLSYRFLIISICDLYLYRYSLTVFRFICFVSFIIGAYYLSSTRLQLMLSFAFLFLLILVFNLKWISFKNRLWKYLGLLAYPVVFFVSVMLPLSYFVSYDFLNWWDEVFSGRMSQTIMAFTQYNIGLWGNAIEMVGSATAETSTLSYFYIDSGYVYWLLAYGIVFTALILLAYSTVFYRSFKYNNSFIYFWCLLFTVTNMINDFFTLSYYSPLVFLLYADFSATPKDAT